MLISLWSLCCMDTVLSSVLSKRLCFVWKDKTWKMKNFNIMFVPVKLMGFDTLKIFATKREDKWGMVNRMENGRLWRRDDVAGIGKTDWDQLGWSGKLRWKGYQQHGSDQMQSYAFLNLNWGTRIQTTSLTSEEVF